MPHLNFLIVTTDQQRADAVGYENPLLRTPCLDGLAARGIAFRRGYTTNPVCTPARCSILTGQYPSRHGAYMVGVNLPTDHRPLVPEAFREAGYYTGLLGKAHFQACLDPEAFESEPFVHDRDFFRGWSGPYYGFEHARLTIGHTTESHACGMHYGAWLEEQGVDIPRYFGRQFDYQGYGRWELPQEYHQSRWVADETCAAIDEAGAEDRPFFLWTSFPDPHNPCFVPEPWADMYDPDDMPAYGVHEGEMEDKPPFYAALLDGRGYGDDPELEQNDARPLPDMDERRTRDRVAAYYGMISLMDHHLGRVVRHLERRGLLDDTVIVFTSDHGEYTGHHGLWGKGLPTYEDMQRVPFLVVHPECRTSGQSSEALQSLVDIPTTCMALAGIAPAPGMQGLDQSPAWLDAAAAVRDWAMVEFRPCEGPFMQWTYIVGRWKLVVYHERPYGELYDLRADPDQLVNLWDEPAQAATRARLTARLLSAAMEKDGVLLPRRALA